MPLWGSSEVRAHCGGMSRSTLQYHVGRAKHKPPFPLPAPICTINRQPGKKSGGVDVYDPLLIRAWWADQQGRREHRGMRTVIVQQLQDPDGVHSARALARALGISDLTVRKWMASLGIPTGTK